LPRGRSSDPQKVRTGYEKEIFNTSPEASRVALTLELIAELDVLADAHLFVTSMSSNMGRLVASLRASRGHDADSALSTDLAWSPAG
jgi:hypothetical protein